MAFARDLSRFPIVGIGSSAGGINALNALFKSFPPHPNLAIVVVQHLPAGQPSPLIEILARWTTMAVHRAAAGMRPEPNCVYVASADEVLTLEAGAFQIRSAEDGAEAGIGIIDSFFESLAADRGCEAVAVILSGTGTHGTAGALCVKRAGGRVLVQEPDTAIYGGMPASVIAEGAADDVLPVQAIAQELAAIALSHSHRPDGPDVWPDQANQALDAILGYIRTQSGFDIAGYKDSPMLWRIQQRMDLRRVVTYEDFEALLKDDPKELDAVIRRIPLQVTEFFHDPEAWDVLDRDVLSAIVAEHREGTPLRIWAPACATGEEAYSTAMLLFDQMAAAGYGDFQLFATDATPEALHRASRGAFSDSAIAAISKERRSRFFYSADGAWQVKKSLRAKMVFAVHDLLADPPFTGLDLVTCRNFLIDLRPEAVRRTMFLLNAALKVGGYLFLGKGEKLPPRQAGFEPVSLKWRIYRKTGPVSSVAIKYPKNHKKAVPAIGHHAAIEHFDLPSVLIDDLCQILRVYGDMSTLLRQPPGQSTYNLLELAPPRLVPHLRNAVKEALALRDAMTMTGLPDGETGDFSLSVRLTPLQTGEHGGAPRLLVSFLRGKKGARHIADNQNMHAWSEAVLLSHQELEASREELRALNEELRSSNDQLNLSNDDLYRVNVRLRDNIAELETQRLVLSSGEVITLFLDRELRIRWFTPALRQLFPLVPSDTGRPITDFVQQFEDRGFESDLLRVLQGGAPCEGAARTMDGRSFLRRVRPHLAAGGVISGVAVTFTDITEIKATEQRQELLIDELQNRIRDLAAKSGP